MTPKNPRVYLLHIRDALDSIEQYTRPGKAKFLTDPQMQDAVLYKLAIIGEAVKAMPQDLRASYPTIPWKDVAGLRDIIIHDYDNTAIPRIWSIVEKNLPRLRKTVQRMLDDTDAA